MLPEAEQVDTASGEDEIIQPVVLPMGLKVTSEWYNNILKDHKLKFEPVLQQLLYDLHYFEKNSRHSTQLINIYTDICTDTTMTFIQLPSLFPMPEQGSRRTIAD